MKILTGNDLRTGAVVWWDGQDWSLHVDDSVDVGDDADAIAAREEALRISKTACVRLAPRCALT